MAVLASAAVLCAGVTVSIASEPAVAKKKVANPLAGRYTGTTEEGGSVSFAITKRGAVVNFIARPSTLTCPQPPVTENIPGVGVIITSIPPPIVLTTNATVSPAEPMRLRGPEPGYPKGHRFDYGGPGGDPAGTVGIVGKLAVGFRGMEGFYELYKVPSGSLTCRSGSGGVGLASWDARKVGGNK